MSKLRGIKSSVKIIYKEDNKFYIFRVTLFINAHFSMNLIDLEPFECLYRLNSHYFACQRLLVEKLKMFLKEYCQQMSLFITRSNSFDMSLLVALAKGVVSMLISFKISHSKSISSYFKKSSLIIILIFYFTHFWIVLLHFLMFWGYLIN